MKGKRLYEMTVKELRDQAEAYERAGNQMWAQFCREQIDLKIRIFEAFKESCQS